MGKTQKKTDTFLEKINTAKSDIKKSLSAINNFLNSLNSEVKAVKKRAYDDGYNHGKKFVEAQLEKQNKPKRVGSDQDIKQLLYKKQKGICKGCKNQLTIRYFHIDHIVPKAKGGKDTENNLQLLCGPCNSLKGSGTMVDLKAKLKLKGLVKKVKRPSLKYYFKSDRPLRAIHKGKEYKATLLTSGEVRYKGNLYPNINRGALAIITPQKSVNAWTFWEVQNDNGHWIKLSDLPPKD